MPQPTTSKITKYKNVTISGLPGAGSSTLGKALAKVTQWNYFSGGDFMRAYAISHELLNPDESTHHLATAYSDDFDRQVDFGMRHDLQAKQKQIFDAWLSGFMAQGIPSILKILVYCSADAVRVDRIANRDNITIQKAKAHIFQRQEKNVEKWIRLYQSQWLEWIVAKHKVKKSKSIWFWYPELYDLTIDTFKYSKEETLKISLQKLGFPAAEIDYSQIFSSG